jgi:endonuclease YncB( thermonuclease family)
MKVYKVIPKWIYDYELHHATKGDKFTYQGQKLKAKVVDIYDGDTLTLVFRYGGKLQQHACRMEGYDSPEMKPPKSQTNRDREITAANKAKVALSNLVSNRVVNIECGQFDKYGRILITIWIKPQTKWSLCKPKFSVNKWMIENGYGLPYDGGTKRNFQ